MELHQIPEEVFDLGILSEEYHDKLLMDLEGFASRANIPPHFVWSRLSQYCTADDLLWVRRMRMGKDHGLLYTGRDPKIPVEDKLMAITGALLRNYVDARVMPVQTILKKLKNDNMPEPTVLLVPNFCLSAAHGGSIASWEVSALLGLLYHRLNGDKKTVLYASSMTEIKASYGQPFHDHINAHYTKISLD